MRQNMNINNKVTELNDRELQNVNGGLITWALGLLFNGLTAYLSIPVIGSLILCKDK